MPRWSWPLKMATLFHERLIATSLGGPKPILLILNYLLNHLVLSNATREALPPSKGLVCETYPWWWHIFLESKRVLKIRLLGHLKVRNRFLQSLLQLLINFTFIFLQEFLQALNKLMVH